MKITIDEAIKALKLDKTCDFEGAQEILEAALQLGIEAMERIQAIRPYSNCDQSYYLPGEEESATTQLEKAE